MIFLRVNLSTTNTVLGFGLTIGFTSNSNIPPENFAAGNLNSFKVTDPP